MKKGTARGDPERFRGEQTRRSEEQWGLVPGGADRASEEEGEPQGGAVGFGRTEQSSPALLEEF